MANDAIDDPILIRLFELWKELRDEHGGFPPKKAIDPTSIQPKVLPVVFIMRVEPDGEFSYRLVGTKAASGVDPTGTYLKDALPDCPLRDHLMALYALPLKEKQPLYTVSHYFDAAENFDRSVHRVLLPLSEDGQEIDGILAGYRVQDAKFLEQSLFERKPEVANVVRCMPLS